MSKLRVKIEPVSDVHKKLKIEAPADSVSEGLEERYREIQKAAVLPGFRAGKVPRALIEKHFQGRAREELLKHLLPSLIEQALKDAKLNSIGTPEVTGIQFAEDGGLRFEVEIDIKPEVKLKSYKGIKLSQPNTQTTEEEIEKVLKNIQEQNAEYRVVEDRAAREGDYLVCEVKKAANGKPPEKQQRVWLSLDHSRDPEKIVDQLIGVQAGEKREIKAQVSETESAVYHVCVSEIKEKQLPALDDAFAKNVAHLENLAALREDISKKLKEEKELRTKRELEAELLDHLAAESKLELPRSVVRHQTERLVEDAKTRLLAQGFQKNQIDQQEAQIRQRIQPQAEREVKIHFILEEVAVRERVTVSEEEIRGKLEQIAGRTKQTVEWVDKYLSEKQLYPGLIDEMKQEKTIAFLLKEAKIVSKDS